MITPHDDTMTNDMKKDMKTEASQENAKAWVEESEGQVEKWAGKVTGDKAKEMAGAAKQSQANATKHVTAMLKDQVSI